MKKVIGFSLLIAIGSVGFAQESARVISSTPILTQVAVPHKVCTNQEVAVQDQKSGVGGLAGLAIGGAIGNRFGSGDGRAAATILGAVGGALIGDRLENKPNSTRIENVQSCQVQNIIETRTTGYNVVYEFAGRQYSTQTTTDPGPFIKIQISPIIQQPVTITPIVQTPVIQYQQTITTVPVYPRQVQPVYFHPHRPHWQKNYY